MGLGFPVSAMVHGNQLPSAVLGACKSPGQQLMAGVTPPAPPTVPGCLSQGPTLFWPTLGPSSSPAAPNILVGPTWHPWFVPADFGICSRIQALEALGL